MIGLHPLGTHRNFAQSNSVPLIGREIRANPDGGGDFKLNVVIQIRMTGSLAIGMTTS
jgi:hypothetical protein